MSPDDVLAELAALGNETTKRTLIKHGAREPFFGVKIEDMKKKLLKRVKNDQKLVLALYDTGVSDAMYLAGLAADPQQMTKAQLKRWAKGAYWYMLSSYTVPGVAAESKFAWELSLKWIDSKQEQIATAGWSTLAAWVGITPDEDLPLDELKKLLDRAEKQIHAAQNRVRYAMNCYVIAVGGFVAPLTKYATAVGKRIGKVDVDMGGTACKVPLAAKYIEMMKEKGRIGRKRASARC